MRVGVVGAGIAGLACAEGLVHRGHEVVVFDKGRGPGGRMSTRRIETAAGTAHFDHGAQYFTARHNDFRSQVGAWAAAGIVAPWPAAGQDAYVGVPAMNAPVRELAARHVVHWSARVTDLDRRGSGWALGVEAAPPTGGVHEVDLVVIAIPAEQAAALLAGVAAGPAAMAAGAVSDPCWTAMLAFPEPLGIKDDCLRGDSRGVIGWAARNNAKPGRTGPESWVAQATPRWSRPRLDAGRDAVTAALAAALSEALGVALPESIGAASHLWRFARSPAGGPGVVYDDDSRLGLCGDWLIAPRVESAWLSGVRLAQRVALEI